MLNNITIREMLCRLILFAGLAAFTTASTIRDCGNGDSIFEITELSLKPDPPVRGQPLNMIVKFNNHGFTVVDGVSTTSLALNFIQYPTSINPLCDSTLCPIEMGLNDRSTSSIWPDKIGGIVQRTIVWYSLEGSELLCVEINTRIDAMTAISYNHDYTYADINAVENALGIWGPEHELDLSWDDLYESFETVSFTNQTQTKRTVDVHPF